MKSLSQQQALELKCDEIVRVLASIERHIAKLNDPGILSTGLGIKRTRGRRRPGVLAARIYVRHKRTPRRKSQVIPDRLALRLWRDDRYVVVNLPTDVEETEGFSPTGRLINNDLCTAGHVLRWKEPGGSTKWGVLTVAHAFDGKPSPLYAKIRLTSSVLVTGRVMHCTAKNASVDAAILRIEQDSDVTALVKAGILSSRNAPALSVRKISQLQSDEAVNASGESLRVASSVISSPVKFSVHDLQSSVPCGSRSIKLGLVVTQGKLNAFEEGTSGSAWKISSMAAAMQCGAKDSYSTGLGQVLPDLLEWSRDKLKTTKVDLVCSF